MKKTLLALALAVGLTSFAGNARADITAFSSITSFPLGYPDGLQQLYFNGSAFIIDSWSAHTDVSHGWNLYNDESMMGGKGLLLWNASSTFQWVTSGSLTAGTSINSSSPLGGSFYQPKFITSSFENNYWGIAYSLGGGNYDYGWVKMSYNSSSNIATLVAAAINTTANQAILVGDTGAAVPEPSTYALFGIGALALFVACRRKAA